MDETIEQRMEQNIRQRFDEQRTLITKALRDNDPAAIKALLDNPQTPAQLRETLQAGGIAAAVDAELTAQKDAIAMALRSGKPEALKALLDNPSTPQQLKDVLAQIPPQALNSPQAVEGIITKIGAAIDEQKPALVQQITDQTLVTINAGLDTAEADALAKGGELGREISAGVKRAFTDSVRQIYVYAIPLVLLAFLIALFIPELPLRRSNNNAAAMAAIE
jgi:hypothetical protein